MRSGSPARSRARYQSRRFGEARGDREGGGGDQHRMSVRRAFGDLLRRHRATRATAVFHQHRLAQRFGDRWLIRRAMMSAGPPVRMPPPGAPACRERPAPARRQPSRPVSPSAPRTTHQLGSIRRSRKYSKKACARPRRRHPFHPPIAIRLRDFSPAASRAIHRVLEEFLRVVGPELADIREVWITALTSLPSLRCTGGYTCRRRCCRSRRTAPARAG